MDFAQSFSNQSSVLSISIMVVDDDPVFLQVMSRMLQKSKYRDPSLMEITVIAVKNSMEALSTLKVQRNNIDIIVTDYYMPGMNGLQLKSEINREFGNLPVIVMSSDTNKEQESLTCGAMCFIPKPIKAIDLTKIYELAVTSKRNGKSILWTEQNQNDICHNVSVPQQIELLPEQANVVKTKKKKKKYSPRSDSRSVNSTNESCVSTDGSRKNQKRKSIDRSGDDLDSRPSKKRKIRWTDFLHDRFLQAIRHIGLDKAVPKKILEFMNVSYLTRENVASHLQKYRIFLRKVAEKGLIDSSLLSGRDIESMFPYARFTELYYNYFKHSNPWHDTSLNRRSFYSRPKHGGIGQSRLLTNAREPVRVNKIPYNYMNRSSTYEPRCFGSNSTLPITSNLNFSNQPSQNEGRRIDFDPPVAANKVNQTPQVLGFGQHGQSTRTSNYGSSISNQLGLSNYGSLTPNQLGLNNYVTSTLNQPGSYGLSTPNQLGLSNYGSLTPNQLGLNNYGSLTPNQLGLNNNGTSSLNQPGSYGTSTLNQLGSYGTSTHNQLGLSNYGTLAPNQPGLNSYGVSTLNQPRLGSYGSLTPNQLGLCNYGLNSNGSSYPTQSGLSSYGSSTPNQPGLNSYEISTPLNQPLSSYGSLTPNEPGLSNYGSLTPHHQGSSHFLYGIESFLNNENVAYKPQAQANETPQPNLEFPQLENLNLYDDLGMNNELPCSKSNFQFDHNKQQEEAASTTEFELPANFSTELNEIFSPEENGDWNFVNINQNHSNGETSNTFAAPETNSTIFNMNPNHNQDVPDPIDWSLLDSQNLVDEDFMNSLFNSEIN